MAFLDSIFNPVLLPLLKLNVFWGLIIITFIVSLIITLAYKYFTNQVEMKRMKEQQKEHQQKMKALRDKPEEMMKVQKEAMKLNLEYMKHSFKPTLITMLPILLIFGWMSGHLSFEPIYPGEAYSLTATFVEGITDKAELIPDEGTEILSEKLQPVEGKAELTWRLKSTAGEHSLKVKLGEEEQTKKVHISKELDGAEQFVQFQHTNIKQIRVNYNKLRPLGELSLFGWQPGWLGLYIIFSLIFSMGLRKAFNLY